MVHLLSESTKDKITKAIIECLKQRSMSSMEVSAILKRRGRINGASTSVHRICRTLLRLEKLGYVSKKQCRKFQIWSFETFDNIVSPNPFDIWLAHSGNCRCVDCRKINQMPVRRVKKKRLSTPHDTSSL